MAFYREYLKPRATVFAEAFRTPTTDPKKIRSKSAVGSLLFASSASLATTGFLVYANVMDWTASGQLHYDLYSYVPITLGLGLALPYLALEQAKKVIGPMKTRKLLGEKRNPLTRTISNRLEIIKQARRVNQDLDSYVTRCIRSAIPLLCADVLLPFMIANAPTRADEFMALSVVPVAVYALSMPVIRSYRFAKQILGPERTEEILRRR